MPHEPVLVTGGAGFVGSNLADALLSDGRAVIVFDNLSRPGVSTNLDWLRSRHPERLTAVIGDLRDADAVAQAVGMAGAVIHLAAQTAVTTSLIDPVADFEVNARGTLNLLEAVRQSGRPMPFLFASTNKVYGALSDLDMDAANGRHLPRDPEVRLRGIDETRPLDFCTPYGCSKGVADQYVLDYARSFGVPAAVLRMSCIYGPRQFGTEDQGWVAHFLIRILSGEDITIFGDGRQVRDILHVADAVAAYRMVLDRIEDLSGRAFNLGGGVGNAVSLMDVIDTIREISNQQPAIRFADWRPGDQPWFVADTSAIEKATDWKPRIGWQDGLRDLAAWLRENRVFPAGRAEPQRRPA
ncbi:NAD-dependent epimerase/dehydratase family protein [Rubellimicrobium sp. CFH 75288]|uniref:NAD-dependent epimerase/dehydratase family protein n=1 Tax=Rubellimicrobium sp. CFH 75288 TaxID=2697034 RepID=UPI001413653B|nr:NAD-dependent epimerase/dehydratase family protein [Rubellimicrobium sp. CFH 75288]NAZ37028.1 NAD-dependent epimerase/dehydratase family protein [Rubellimicrobium sp. CFH 75288]